jgi:hypothetical protein
MSFQSLGRISLSCYASQTPETPKNIEVDTIDTSTSEPDEARAGGVVIVEAQE